MTLRLFNPDGKTLPSVAASPRQRETSQLGQYIPLIYHYNMLQDRLRMGAFDEAIQHLVRPDMHVMELGSGTGVLSAMAARCGAKVTAVERNPELVRVSRDLIALNGLSNQIQVIEADAAQYYPEQPVDVVICEMLHVAMLREKQLHVIEAFKQHYQRHVSETLPTFVPEASLLMVQPIEHDFDFGGYWAPIPVFQAADQVQTATRELGPLTIYTTIDYAQPFATQFDIHLELPIHESGTVNAVRFVTQNALAVIVQQQRAVSWPNQCLVLPLSCPLTVRSGETLTLRMKYQAGDAVEVVQQSMLLQHDVTRPQRRAA